MERERTKGNEIDGEQCGVRTDGTEDKCRTEDRKERIKQESGIEKGERVERLWDKNMLFVVHVIVGLLCVFSVIV